MLKIKSWIAISLMMILSGCGIFGEYGNDTNNLIPPSANYMQNDPKYPLEAPVYPPLNQPYTPNMLNNNDSKVMNIDRLNVGEANIGPYPSQSPQNTLPNQDQAQNNKSVDIYIKDQRGDYMPNYVAPTEIVPYDQPMQNNTPQDMAKSKEVKDPNIIQNSPMLTPNNIIELSAVGMGVAPESTISPSQALALAKRAAIIDAYRQIGEKMYGIKLNAQDTVRDMVLVNSIVKTKVEALIKNAEVVETIYKDGLCQITMELKLDGKIWHKILSDAK